MATMIEADTKRQRSTVKTSHLPGAPIAGSIRLVPPSLNPSRPKTPRPAHSLTRPGSSRPVQLISDDSTGTDGKPP